MPHLLIWFLKVYAASVKGKVITYAESNYLHRREALRTNDGGKIQSKERRLGEREKGYVSFTDKILDVMQSTGAGAH
ncbi:hypothetical protein DV515_00005004 [Chloebia gouldiae]|uniref:Uncharacterized protein n=1 Tax=Chloebia gouldiae TaxID=44316 RepID=A0A3L8SPQ3_CHLGU|nr:hypothetical protein DV515_00005004 [Chloebia gouldiae]